MDLVTPLSAVAPTDTADGIFAGYKAADSPVLVDDPRISWTEREADLFRPGVSRLIIQDCHLLSNRAFALAASLPTLIQVATEREAAHLTVLTRARAIVLSPLDAVASETIDLGRRGLADHRLDDPDAFFSPDLVKTRVPASLAGFRHLRKSEWHQAGRHDRIPDAGHHQHVYQVLGAHDALAQTLMRTAEMVRTGKGGPFGTLSPTVVCIDPNDLSALTAMALQQSVVVIAPFELLRGQHIDALITRFIDARPEPFLLGSVDVLRISADATLGVLQAEYVV